MLCNILKVCVSLSVPSVCECSCLRACIMQTNFNWIFAYFLNFAVCILLANNGTFNMGVWWLPVGSAPAQAPRILVFLVSHVVGLFLLRTATTRRRRTRKVAGCSSIFDGACHVLVLK